MSGDDEGPTEPEPMGAFSEGVDSFRAGLPRGNCPYPPDSDDRAQWLAGWDREAGDRQAAGAT